jgi:orotate phosphoribosyltransferase
VLKGGKLEPYFVDFDLITEDPTVCSIIAREIGKKIQEVSEYRGKAPDFLGFIEKDTIGTVGAIKLAGFISSITKIPNILIRHTRELPYGRIKISERFWSTKTLRLKGKNVLLISDVSTTAQELIEAINCIKMNGGEVSDVILYFSKCSTDTVQKLESMGVKLHPLLSEPYLRYVLLFSKKKAASQLRSLLLKDMDAQ